MGLETWSPVANSELGTMITNGMFGSPGNLKLKPEGEGWQVTGFKEVINQLPKGGFKTSHIPIYTRLTDPQPPSTTESSPTPESEPAGPTFQPFTFSTENPLSPSARREFGRVPDAVMFPRDQGANIYDVLSDSADLQRSYQEYLDAKGKNNMNNRLAQMGNITNQFMNRLGGTSTESPATVDSVVSSLNFQNAMR